MISVVMCTARKNPGYQTLADSLAFNLDWYKVSGAELIVVDEGIWYDEKPCRDALSEAVKGRFSFQHVAPKPTVWRGPHRLTAKDYWDKQSALNTAVCYAKNNRLAFVDDNCVLGRGWILPHITPYLVSPHAAVCGAYRYWHPNVTIHNSSEVSGEPHKPGDHRLQDQPIPGPCNPSWLYGGNCSFFLDDILEANGWDEVLSGSGGLEDSEFSVRISRLASPIFNPNSVVEYLTDNQEVVGNYVSKAVADIHGSSQSEEPKRCKGFNYKDPNGTIHWFTWNHVPIWWLTGHKVGKHEDGINYKPVYEPKLAHHRSRVTTIGNKFTLRLLRHTIQNGRQFPIPTEPTIDWRDRQPLKEM